MGSVIVVGAGISGLTVAWWLRRAGVNVTVLERGERPGGTMHTVIDGDWLIEGGPNSALETTPLFQQLFGELDILDQLRYADATSDKRYILRGGKLLPLPMSPGPFLRSRLWTVGGKLRLLKEPFVGKAAKEESVAEFVERRLGREFLDYAINPFVAGVYAGDPSALGVRWAFPKLFALEEKYGGLIKGMIKGRKERRERAEKSKDRAKMFSFVEGMYTLPETIARKLERSVQYNSTVTSIEYQTPRNGSGSGFKVTYTAGDFTQSVVCDAVVLSVPAYATRAIVGPLSPDLARVLDDVYYPPVVEVFLGYRADQAGIPLDGFGYLVPEVERRKILGTIWSSSLFEGRAPAGHIALTTFLGGARQPGVAELEDSEVLPLVRSELESIMKVRGEPVYSRINRWSKAIPQYNLGYGAILKSLEQAERNNPGLFFCSNYRGGISVGDCVMSADRTAQTVVSFLKSSKHQSITSEVQ